MLPKSSGDQVLQLSASSDSWLWRRKCLIIVPKTAKSVAVIVKDSSGGVSSNNKKQEEIDGSESELIRCRYGETKVSSRQYAEQDIKWLGGCEAGASWSTWNKRKMRTVEQMVRLTNKSPETGGNLSREAVRFVIEVDATDSATGDGVADQVLEVRYSDASEMPPPNNFEPTPLCGARPQPAVSRPPLSSRRGSFVLGGEGECEASVHLMYGYKIRFNFIISVAAKKTKGKVSAKAVVGRAIDINLDSSFARN